MRFFFSFPPLRAHNKQASQGHFLVNVIAYTIQRTFSIMAGIKIKVCNSIFKDNRASQPKADWVWT